MTTSFWDTLGSIAKVASGITGVYDAARTAVQTQDPGKGPDGLLEDAKQFGAAFFKNQEQPAMLAAKVGGAVLNSQPAQDVLAPINWTMNQASHGLAASAAVGGILSDKGETGIDTLWSHDLWDSNTWEQAWKASQGVTGGEAVALDQMNQFTGQNPNAKGNRWWAGDKTELDEARKKTAFNVSAGAMDILSTWYADPTIGLGKVAKAARVGSKIIDAAQAEDVAKVIGSDAVKAAGVARVADHPLDLGAQAAKVPGMFATSPQETASRLYAQVAKTDNMTVTDAAAHFKPILERSGDSAPIVGLLGQAGNIKDLNLQRAVKADTILAAAGSQLARDRLIASAPDIARALQRSSLPPEQFAIADHLIASGLSGQALMDATGQWATAANKAELQAYAKDLDDIHTRIAKTAAVGEVGGVEQVDQGILGAAKQKYRAGMAHEFFYNPGPSSRTVRVVHWATGQRMKDVINVADPVLGHDELMDSMTRSGLFSGPEREAMATKWWSAPTQEARASIAHAYPQFLLARLGEKHGLTNDEMADVLSRYGGWAASARTYATQALEDARVNNLSRVTLEDPGTGVPTSIDALLFEKHVADSAAVPDINSLERIVRATKGAKTAGDKVKDAFTPLGNQLEDINDIWRTLTLARPGLIARTQFDTQARSMVTIGATNIVADAMRGLGHKLTDMLTGPQVQEVVDHADTLAQRESLTSRASQLRQQAAQVPGEAGNQMLARADALEAQAAQDVTKTITGKRIVTDERTVNLGNGVRVPTRAAGSDVERQMLGAALHTGPQSISDAILHVSGKLQGDLVENADNWVTTMPDSEKWANAWLRSKDALIQSPAGRKIVETLDMPNVDMMKTLREAPEVRAAWREVRTGNPYFESWLDRAISQAQWTAPTTDVRQALLSGKVLKPEDAEAMFAKADDVDSALPPRMPVHAPSMDYINPTKDRLNVMDQVRKAVGWMSDQPDTVLGRVPFYTEKYFSHFEQLGRREVERNGEISADALQSIEKVARHRAIMDTRQTMYDTARFTGAHDRAARMMFAFVGAWEDAMRGWGRIFYDDPSKIGQLTKTWFAPDRGGLVVDQNGNKVTPGDGSREQWLVLPMRIPGTQVQSFRLRKDSFNSMFQGDVPWAPGFSPMVQVPVATLAAQTFPEIADPNFKIGDTNIGNNPVLRQLFGFGLPKTGPGAVETGGSMANQFVPGFVKRFADIFNGDSASFSDAYAMGLNAAMIQARQQGKDPNTKAVQEWAAKQAESTARSLTIMNFVSNFGLGLSGQGATKADFYRQRYREISANADALKAKGMTVDQEFVRQHPEAAGLKWSFSTNQTGIDASLQVENRTRKYAADISKNPDFGWFYVGSDNIGGQFSSAIYDSQFNREGTPGSGDGWRAKQDPAQIRTATNASLGWDSWNTVSEKVNLVLQQRGLHSINQKGAEDLKQIKDDFKTKLANENPDWFKDYSTFNPAKLQTFIDQVAAPALKDGRLKNRSDIKEMGDYLELRQKAMEIANSNGYSLSSNQAAPLRDVLSQAGAAMAADNLGFSQMWTRLFSREVG